MDPTGAVGWGDNNDWRGMIQAAEKNGGKCGEFMKNSTSHQLIELIGPPGLHCRMDCPFFLCVTGSWGLGGRQGHTSSQRVGVACAICVELSGGSVSSKILPFS